VNGPSPAHGLLVDERLTEACPSRHFADSGYKKKGPMRCHTGPEKQRGIATLRAYASLRKHTRAAKHLAATCCTNATETRCATLARQPRVQGPHDQDEPRKAMTDTTNTLSILGRIDAIRRIVKRRVSAAAV
jgi:hypothetical protein